MEGERVAMQINEVVEEVGKIISETGTAIYVGAQGAITEGITNTSTVLGFNYTVVPGVIFYGGTAARFEAWSQRSRISCCSPSIISAGTLIEGEYRRTR